MTYDIAILISSHQHPSVAARRALRSQRAREWKKKRLLLEILEPRLVLSQITWNATASPAGGDWDLGSNWIGGSVPTAADTAIIQGLTSPGTVYLDSNKADSVSALTTDASTTLEVVNGSLSVGPSSTSTLGGPVSIDKGAALKVGSSASVTIGPGQTVMDNGTLSFATGDSVSLPTAELATTQIVVNGSLSATHTNFINPGNVSESLNQIYVGSGGEVTASSSTFGVNQFYLTANSTLKSPDLTGNIFDTTIYAPILDVPLLAANQSFQDVDILGGSLGNGQSVSLSPMGTVSTVNQRYVFPSGFTVGAGATLNVDAGASVLIRDAQQLLVTGTLNITSASSFAIEDLDDGGGTGGITVDGTIMISDTSLTRSGGTNGNDTTFLQVDSGAKVTISGSAFSWDQLLLNSGASTISISGNDFSNVGDDGVVASGAKGSDIPLDHNYWGTSDASLIQAKILDHHENSNLPTVVFHPFVNATATSASPAQASSGPNDQAVNLSATVSTPAGVLIDDGTVTFTILKGTQVIGKATAPAPVSSGSATAVYTLPGGTAVGHYTIDASYSGTDLYLPSTDNTQLLNVTPAAADKLVIHTQPSMTATAGQPFEVQPVIYVEDQNGNLQTSDNSTVVTVSLASGTGTLQGTKQVTVIGGVATFAGLADNVAGIISLQFAGDSLTVGPSNNITVSPAAPFQLVIQTQPSSAAIAGQHFATQPVVDELDQFGNLETGDNTTGITASLASGNGTLRGTTTAILSGGVASFAGLADNTAGIISLNFAGGGFTAGPSNNIFISPGPASQLVIQTPPYTAVVAGNPLTDPIVINEEDQYGNIETGDNSTVVTASLNSGAGTLDGTKTATVANGVASFNGLEDDKAGTLALQFTAPDLPPVIAPPSIVTAAAAKMVVIVTKPPSGVVSGQAFGLTVNTQDPFGNTDPTYNGPVTVMLASGSGTLSGNTTMDATNGVAAFTDLVDTTSGAISLNVTSGSLNDTSTPAITVNPAAPSQLKIQMQPSLTATAGLPFTTQPVIDEEDQYGNLVTGDNSTVLTAYLGSGAGPLQGTVTATLSGGVATFAGLNDTTAGTITLRFMGGGLNSEASVPIVISPAAASKLVVQTQPSATAMAGQAFSTQPVIVEEDQFGNLETGDNGTMVTASLGSGIGPLLGTTTATMTGGVATLAGLADDTAGTIVLDYSGGGLKAGPSTVVVSPAAASKLLIQTQVSATATAGQAFATQPILELEDKYGNVETGDNTTSVTASLGSGLGPLQGASTVIVKRGVATFSGLADKLAETITINFTGESLTAGPSTVAISPAAAGKLVIQTEPPATATAGHAFAIQPVVVLEDQYGNVETGDNSTVITAVPNSGSALLNGATATVKGGVATFTNLEEDEAETLSLKFTDGGLASVPTSSINVSAAAATQLVVVPTQSGNVTAGVGFAILVEAQDPFGNVDPTFNGSVTVALGQNPGGESLGGTLTAPAVGGVATFTNLTLDKPSGEYSLQVSSGVLESQTPSKQVAPPPAPTVIGQTLATTQKTNKKGKPQGKATFSGFKIQFSTAMNLATVGLKGSYQMDATTIKRKKNKPVKSLKPVSFMVQYEPSNDTVTLTIKKGTNPFANGGQITILTSPGGVSSAAGVLLNPSYATFTISPKAKVITLA